MKKLKFICDNIEYFINDEKIYCVLKLLGYKDNAIWRIKSKNNERYKINSLILEKILKEYKLDSKYFLNSVNKIRMTKSFREYVIERSRFDFN